MKQTIFLILAIISFSCTEKKPSTKNKNFISIITSGQKISPDSISIPDRVIAKQPQIVTAGKPTIGINNASKFDSINPTLHLAGIPIIFTPGKDTFLLPVKVIIKGEIRIAGTPKITPAKDMVSREINPGNFSSYFEKQGLKNHSILCLLQDKIGNIWLGTNGGGIIKFDGKNFTNYGKREGLIHKNYIRSLSEDKNGNIWIGQDNGVSYFNGKYFTYYSFEESFGIDRNSNIFIDKKNNVWFSSNNSGLIKYDGKTFTNYTVKQGLAGNSTYEIAEDKNGDLWISTSGGVSCFNGLSFKNYTQKEGLLSNNVRALFLDKNQEIWFGTGHGLSCFDGKNFKNYKGFLSDNISKIVRDKSGNFWIGTADGYQGETITAGGLTKFDGKTITNYTEKDGLLGSSIEDLLIDKSESVWIATRSGFHQLKGKHFRFYTEKDGLINNYVASICKDNIGNMYFGTDAGLSCYNDMVFSNYTEKEGILKAFIRFNKYVSPIIKCVDGKICFSTGGGFSLFDGKNFTNYTENEGLVGPDIVGFFEDKKENLWIAMKTKGLVCFDKKNFINYSKKQGLPDDFFNCIYGDIKGNIWIGTESHGVYCINGKTVMNISEKEGLSSNQISTIYEDRFKNLWIGTNDQGLNCFDGKKLVKLTMDEGLVSNSIRSIIEDENGNLWFGTKAGLSKITSRKLEKLVNSRFEIEPIKDALFYNYDEDDGFLGNKCIGNSVMQDNKGQIWWGAKMLTCYNPKEDIVDTAAPVISICDLRLFGEKLYWKNLGAVLTDSNGIEVIRGEIMDTILANGVSLSGIRFNGLTKWYNLPVNLSLPYNNNNVTFSFLATHLQSRNHIRYQYKLSGLEDNWSSITNSTEASFGNLPPGNYTFSVRAMNQSGIWSEPIEYVFEVRPPWWQTWLFRIILVCFIIGFLVFYVKWRERSLKEKQRVLESEIKIATRDIKEQKHLIEEKHKEITDSINYAERIQRSLLASSEMLNNNLPEHFVFFQPKDIVSGDFYWASKLVSSSGVENFALVTADSTGHGVPGAIMSILNISCIEKAIESEKLINPADIFNHTRGKIIETLKKDGSIEGGKDGMDASLICFDFKNSNFTYAAANNPIWIVRNNELIELKGDKMPVGKHDKDQVPFTQHEFEINKGDVVYTLTDGFPDQFGGVKGKKFMYKQLKETLVSIAHKPMTEQKETLNSILKNWMGDVEQVDDITIIGIRV